MDAKRFNHCQKWIGVGAVLGYLMPVLVGSLTLLYSWGRNDALNADALWFLPVLWMGYTTFGLWVGHAFLGAGCGLASQWLPRWFGRWRRLAALTALVLVACHAASVLYFQWFPMLWLP